MTLIAYYLKHPQEQAQHYLYFFMTIMVLIDYEYYLIIYFHFSRHAILQFNNA